MTNTEPLETTPMTIPATEDPGSAIIDVRDASSRGVELMRQRVENQKKMLQIAISLTTPNQWVVFSGNGRESIYPTGGAADAILRRAFGLTWGEKTVTVHDTPDGLEAVCKAWLMYNGEPVEQFEGRRQMGGYIQNEADLRKGSVENMKSVAVRDLLGLRFRTPGELRELGIDITRMERRAEFQTHTKEGKDAPGDVATVPFGKNKGKPVSELKDKALDWYLNAAKESVADPTKSKWVAKNQAWLDVLEAEAAKRRGDEPPKTETKDGEQGDFDYGPPPMGDE